MAVFEEAGDVVVVVEAEGPGEGLAGGVGDADALGGGLGAAEFEVDLLFWAGWRVLDGGGFEGDGDEALLDEGEDCGFREDRLTGGAGEDSTAFVVGGAVDEDPEGDGFVLFAGGLDAVEEAGFPGDFAPGNILDAHGVDLLFEGTGGDG